MIQTPRFPWLVLRPAPEITLELEAWSELGRSRARFLSQFQHLRESQGSRSVSSSSFAQLINKFYSANKLAEDYQNMFAGHLFLRLSATTTPRLEGWLKETEGDVFEQFFRHLPSDDERLEAMRSIIGKDDSILRAEDAIRTLGISQEGLGVISIRSLFDGWAVKFGEMPALVGRKLLTAFGRQSRPTNSLLLRGYVFSRPSYLYGTIKKLFERKLAKEVALLRGKMMDREFGRFVSDFVKSLSEEVRFLSAKGSGSGLDMIVRDGVHHDASSNLSSYAPCMRYLRMQLEHTGHIPHMHRVQLGLFLKAMGMDVETQLRYWFETAIDNLNVTYEKFLTRAGYQIKYLYGLEGGKKDYAVPKCQTLISNYFCLFQHVTIETLETILPTLYPLENKRYYNEIFRETQNYRPKRACSLLFEALTKRPFNINHPIQFVKGFIKELPIEFKEPEVNALQSD